MRCDRIIPLIVMGIFLLTIISATCTVTFDKNSYIAGETVTASMVCDSATEKSDNYILNWTNASNALFKVDAGTTPATVGQTFYKSYTIPTNWPAGVYINATLVGNGSSDLEGTDYANITALASSPYALLITNVTFGGGLIGEISSLSAIVKNVDGRGITGGKCVVSALSNDESKIVSSGASPMINGQLKGAGMATAAEFDEGVQYVYEIECYCGAPGGATECIDELGGSVNRSIGSARGFFETPYWLRVNTLVNKYLYQPKEDIFICANLTNVNYSSRIKTPINYEVRCSEGQDQDYDLDRIIVIQSDSAEIRGISANKTQMQCKKFVIPELDLLEGKSSECYASTEVGVLDNNDNQVMSYRTTSPMFNITSSELNLEPDWQWASTTRMNSIVNLSDSSFNNYNGTGRETLI